MYTSTNLARKQIDKAQRTNQEYGALVNTFRRANGLVCFIADIFMFFFFCKGTDNKTELAKGESVCEKEQETEIFETET